MQAELVGNNGHARVLAMGLDNLLAALLGLFVAAKLPGLDDIARAELLCGVYLAYFFISEAVWGRSLGKLVTGLVVCGVDGSRCGWKRAAIRTFLRALEVNPLLFGALPGAVTVLSTRRKQRLGDILARTVVIERLASKMAPSAEVQ